MYEDSDSFRHHVDLKRYGINPTAACQVGPNTRIDLSYEYFHDRRTADRGVPSEGRAGPRLHATFFGDPEDSYAKADVTSGRSPSSIDFGSGLTLRNQTMFGDYGKFYQNIYAAAPSWRRRITRAASGSAAL